MLAEVLEPIKDRYDYVLIDTCAVAKWNMGVAH